MPCPCCGRTHDPCRGLRTRRRANAVVVRARDPVVRYLMIAMHQTNRFAILPRRPNAVRTAARLDARAASTDNVQSLSCSAKLALRLASIARALQIPSPAAAPANYRPRSNPHSRAIARGFVHSAFFDAGPRTTPTSRYGPAPKNANDSLPFLTVIMNGRNVPKQMCLIPNSATWRTPHGQTALGGCWHPRTFAQGL